MVVEGRGRRKSCSDHFNCVQRCLETTDTDRSRDLSAMRVGMVRMFVDCPPFGPASYRQSDGGAEYALARPLNAFAVCHICKNSSFLSTAGICKSLSYSNGRTIPANEERLRLPRCHPLSTIVKDCAKQLA